MAKNQTTYKEHSISMRDRRELTLSGVCEIISFSDTCIIIKTTMGDLNIRGDKLNLGKLNTETGELFVSGNFSILRYTKSKRKGTTLEGLFK